MSKHHQPHSVGLEEIPPDDPEYELIRAIDRESQANLDYFLEHEVELFERYPGHMVVVYAGGQEVQACADPDELHELLDSLPNIQRAAALYHGQREPGTAWAL